jgi:hypothetical protein
MSDLREEINAMTHLLPEQIAHLHGSTSHHDVSVRGHAEGSHSTAQSSVPAARSFVPPMRSAVQSLASDSLTGHRSNASSILRKHKFRRAANWLTSFRPPASATRTRMQLAIDEQLSPIDVSMPSAVADVSHSADIDLE